MQRQPVSIRDSYRGSGKLKGKNALITGGDSGIGRAVAVHFAREGCNVFFTYISEDQDAEETKRLCESEGTACHMSRGDLRTAKYRGELLEQFSARFDGLHILVNNAGTQFTEQSLEDISEENLRETFDLNIMGMILLTKEALPMMNAGARIINTTSITSYKGKASLVDYASTKGAITSFTRSLSGQLADMDPLDTGDHAQGGSRWLREGHPLGRCGEPCEVAPAYVYLAGEDCSYMTGQVLHINGGTIIGG